MKKKSEEFCELSMHFGIALIAKTIIRGHMLVKKKEN